MTTSYDNRITPELVLSLARVGMVSVEPSQINIRARRGISLADVIIPKCFYLEVFGVSGGLVQVALRLKQKKEAK